MICFECNMLRYIKWECPLVKKKKDENDDKKKNEKRKPQYTFLAKWESKGSKDQSMKKTIYLCIMARTNMKSSTKKKVTNFSFNNLIMFEEKITRAHLQLKEKNLNLTRRFFF